MESTESKATKISIGAKEKINLARSFSDIELIKTEYLGRNGIINQLFKTEPIKENPQIGKLINQLKSDLENLITSKILSLDEIESAEVDLTTPTSDINLGSTHLISQTIEEIQNIFEKMGFVRRRYQEVDTDWYYAEGLNIPKDHPARDDQETFYLTNGMVLTAHTSNGQLHEMDHHKPPIKMTNIGKTYRRQADATHNSMFHQFEGLLIDKDINISHLVGITEYFAKSYFGNERKIRLRPHHFQFTEPSFEIDISCGLCNGTGISNAEKCKICKSGWLELGGAGMVHPNVLKNGHIDSKKYSGFAFGWGVERVLMMKSGIDIPDLRQLFTDDIRFLNQF